MKNEYIKFQYLFTKVFIFEDNIQIKSLGNNTSFKKENVKSVSTGSLSLKAKVDLGGKKDLDVQFGNKKDLHNFVDFLNGVKSFVDLKNIYGVVDEVSASKGSFLNRRNAKIAGVIFFFGSLVSLSSSLWFSIIYLIAGLIIFPKTYDLLKSRVRLNLSKNSRVIASFVLLMIAGITYSAQAPSPSAEVAQSEAKSEKVQLPADAPLDEKIKAGIISTLGEKTNMGKATIISVEVDKYKPSELSEYKYKSADEVVGVFVKINASENLTTNLQKGTMSDEAVKVFKEAFDVSPNVGDVIVWSHLPVKDQYGNLKDDVAIVYSMSRSLYQKINWASFSHRDLPNLLKVEHSIDDRNNYHESIKF